MRNHAAQVAALSQVKNKQDRGLGKESGEKGEILLGREVLA